MPIEMSDGSQWIYHPNLGEWTGWVPGEDGIWNLTDDEFEVRWDAEP